MNARTARPMTAIGMTTPTATLAPVDSPDDAGTAAGDCVAKTTWPLLVETAAREPLAEETVLVGITRSLMVGRGAFALTVHPPEEETGHLGGTSVGEYVARDTPVGVRVSHWLVAVSFFPPREMQEPYLWRL